ncbi:Uncharacterized protein HZ326_20489 [Fusarium oxysporum f. sp. albedinis]|nr:putative NADPH-dependent quinone reductase tdiC [Fusarium oxysporum f. sp. albedinis]KAJ0136514.1 Uncharacterized protein HZ326_20489 [Fusarium oxysporum f. sp. albedinis]
MAVNTGDTNRYRKDRISREMLAFEKQRLPTSPHGRHSFEQNANLLPVSGAGSGTWWTQSYHVGMYASPSDIELACEALLLI